MLVALTLSAAISIYLRVFGTYDIEDSLNASFSIAAGRSGGFANLGAREFGTFSYLGVPLFDALQGIGGRLPYQSSWAQSPEWPLRYIFSDPSFYSKSCDVSISVSHIVILEAPVVVPRADFIWRFTMCAGRGVSQRK